MCDIKCLQVVILPLLWYKVNNLHHRGCDWREKQPPKVTDWPCALHCLGSTVKRFTWTHLKDQLNPTEHSTLALQKKQKKQQHTFNIFCYIAVKWPICKCIIIYLWSRLIFNRIQLKLHKWVFIYNKQS